MLQAVRRYLATLLLLVIVFVLWEVLVRLLHVEAYILPPPSRIMAVFFTRFGFLLGHAAATLVEVALGIVLGVAGGFVLAVLIFYSRTLERALYPLIIASQMIPVFAIAPLLVIWFGYGLWPKVTVAGLIVFFPIVVNMVDGLRSVNEETIDVLRTLNATRIQIFLRVRLPGSLPSLFSGLKVGVTLSVVGATIGEWVGAKSGLGYLMIQSNALLRIDLVFAAIFMLSLLGLLLFALVSIMERRLLRWMVPRSSKGERR
jgi:ABC-type nitrate/sulfonate/bicarbonate transport system permease component